MPKASYALNAAGIPVAIQTSAEFDHGNRMLARSKDRVVGIMAPGSGLGEARDALAELRARTT